MADFELHDVEQCFSEDQRQILDGVGMQRVTESMKRLHLLRREEIRDVASGIQLRLSPPQQLPAAAPAVLLRAGGGAVVSPSPAPTSAPASAPASAPSAAPDCAEARQSQALAAAQFAADPDDDAADLKCLLAVLARAKVLPTSKRPDFARKLLDQGVSDERAIWTSLSAHPPHFDLVRDIGMTPAQQLSLDTYLKNLKL